jgi:hypothetical protein
MQPYEGLNAYRRESSVHLGAIEQGIQGQTYQWVMEYSKTLTPSA